MSTILDEIVAYKKTEVAERKAATPLAELEKPVADAGDPRGFAAGLAAQTERGAAVIAEVKRGSPSLGCIRPDMDAIAQVTSYENGGAAALSVLTDEKYFFARPEDFADVRANVGIPVLRKDFMIDPYQIVEARAMGADCILLIMACLEDDMARRLAEFANDLGMDVLCETHNEDEIKRAIDHVPYDLLGINNRNLKTFSTSWELTLELADLAPDRNSLVAESGLHDPDAIRCLWNEGIKRFLVGEAFVKSDDPEAKVRSFVDAPGA